MSTNSAHLSNLNTKILTDHPFLETHQRTVDLDGLFDESILLEVCDSPEKEINIISVTIKQAL